MDSEKAKLDTTTTYSDNPPPYNNEYQQTNQYQDQQGSNPVQPGYPPNQPQYPPMYPQVEGADKGSPYPQQQYPSQQYTAPSSVTMVQAGPGPEESQPMPDTTAAIVVSIISIFCCCCLGIGATYFAATAKSSGSVTQARNKVSTAYKLAGAAFVIGVIVIIVSIIF